MKKWMLALPVLGFLGGFVLRLLQLTQAMDSQGLLVRGDGLSLALYGLCVLVALAAGFLCLRLPKGADGLPEGPAKGRGIVCLVCALGLLASHLPPSFEGGVLNILIPVLAFGAVCALAVEGIFCLQGNKGSLFGGCLLPIYLAATLIQQYLGWSKDPQVADYGFRLLFIVFAMLSAYHLAGFRVKGGKCRLTAFYVICALCFAGPTLAEGGLRNILHTLALSVYLAVSFWPCLWAQPEPIE